MEKLVQYLQELWQNAIVPSIKSSWKKSSDNTDRIVKAVENKEISIGNIDIELDSLETRLDGIKASIDDKDLSVNLETDLKPVSKSIESLKNELRTILKAIPDKVSTDAIENALGSILSELESKQPTDVKKIEKLLGELKTSIESLSLDVVIPEFPNFEDALKKYIKNGRIKVEVDRAGGGGSFTNQDILDAYHINNYDISSDPIYMGGTDKDGNYVIKKITLSTGVCLYATGTDYSTDWTNRASLSYGTFDEIF